MSKNIELRLKVKALLLPPYYLANGSYVLRKGIDNRSYP